MTITLAATLASVLCLASSEAGSWSSTAHEMFGSSIQLAARRMPARPATGRADYEKVRLGLKLQELRGILRAPGRDVFQLGNPTDIPGAAFVSAAPKGTRIRMRSGGNWEVGIVDNAPGRMWVWACQEALLLVQIDQDTRITDFMLFTHEPDR